MKLINIYLLALLCLFFGLINAQNNFNIQNISFEIPTGWSLTEQENLGNEGYYLSVEKNGLDSSGLVTMTWVKDKMDLAEWLEEAKTELKSSLGQNAKLNFKNEKSITFNNIKTESFSYTFSMFGFEHRGLVMPFYKNDKSFLIIKQEANEDIEINQKGFKTIEKSFKI